MILAAVMWWGADLGPEPARPTVVLVIGLVLMLAGLGTRRWSVLFVAGFVVAAHVGAAADHGHVPLAAATYDGQATVLDDPRPVGAGWRVEVKLADGSRVEATGFGSAGWDLATVSVGEAHRLTGRVRPPGTSQWLRARHITGLLTVEAVEPLAEPGLVWAVPEFARGLVVAGGSTMTERERALYLGLVIGDDRFQPLGQKLNFRSSGLTHLLAVSGQNVAFVLAVASGPLLLVGRRWRLLITVFVLVIFAAVTRMEPSVLRATAAAVLAVWSASSGRERSGLVILSLAVCLLICLDPFLVGSVGFQLSVAASAGILVLGPAIERRLPGPALVTGPLATTLAAQLGVSPLLGVYFGPVSVVSIPANLAAGWAAAAVMTLGLTAGVVAGLTPDPVASVIQWPTTLLLAWLEWVASVGGRAPLPRLGAGWLMALTAAVLVAVNGSVPGATDGHHRRSVRVRLGAAAAAGVMLIGAWPTSAEQGPCGAGMTWYPVGDGGSSVLVVGGEATDNAIGTCLAAGVRDVELVVATRGGRRTAELVTALREVVTVGSVVAPPQHRIIGARRLTRSVTVITGGGQIRLRVLGDDLLSAEFEQPPRPTADRLSS